jgi:LPS O-antigen subunit length determinant protein (WzzB/FepE family)
MEAITLDQCNAFRTREQELRNKQIQNDFDIRQEDSRAEKLREIIARNPDASAIDNRQIVSLEKGTERFLSPAAQLVASEIKIADMKLAEASRERERTASALTRDYYCQAQQALTQPTTGKAFLNELKNIQAAVFQGQDKSIDIIEQTWNELDVQRENWASSYLSSMRFVASPEGTEVKERKPGLALGLVLGGLLGGMLGVFGALVRAWWRGDQEKTGV